MTDPDEIKPDEPTYICDLCKEPHAVAWKANDRHWSNEKCLMCNTRHPKSCWWMFIWNNKSGYACEDCANKWYAIGQYLVDKAEAMLLANGVSVQQTKDKFGEWRIYCTANDDKQTLVIKSLEKQYQTVYPEFSWSFD